MTRLQWTCSLWALTLLALVGLPPIGAAAQTASPPRTRPETPRPHPGQTPPVKRLSRRILTIFGQERLLPANIALDASFRSTLEADANYDFEFYSEFIDAIRFGDPKNEARFADYLKDKYANRPIDFLVAAGPQALDFLIKYRHRLFPHVPLASVALSEEGLKERQYPADIRHVPIHLDPVPTLEMALRLQPETQRAVVIYGASPFDKGWDAPMRRSLRAYEQRLKIEYWSGWAMERMEREIARLPPKTIIIFCTVFQDGAGRFFLAKPSRND